jgi:hypothetical protein
MLCEHLAMIERALAAERVPVTSRGQAWSQNCREWVYVDCFLDLPAIRARFALADCVQDHAHRGTHDGQERGLVCAQCHDAIMGHYEAIPDRRVFPLAGNHGA